MIKKAKTMLLLFFWIIEAGIGLTGCYVSYSRLANLLMLSKAKVSFGNIFIYTFILGASCLLCYVGANKTVFSLFNLIKINDKKE